MASLRVYICNDPQHDELVRMIRDIVSNVKGERPRVEVKRIKKLSSAEDFPYYVRQLEEYFGRIATAEFRKYGIESLPAVVFNDQLVLQGKVPTLEELEEALAYAGLRISRVRGRAQPRPAAAPPAQRGPSGPLGAPARQPRAPPGEISAALRESMIKRLPEVRGAAPAFPGAGEGGGGGPLAAPPERAVQPQPPASQPKPTAPAEGARGGVPTVPQPLIIEELTISPAPAPQPLARKTCLSCIFYDRQSQRCLLLRRPVADPGRPIC